MCWIYGEEIAYYWNYMRFLGEYSEDILVDILLYTSLIALALPTKIDTRGFLLTLLHYFFFIPSVVYIVYNDVGTQYIVAFVATTAILLFGSKFDIPLFEAPATRRGQIMMFLMFITIVALLLQVIFGGLSTFDINLEDVYMYRQEAAENMPEIFAYVFSNISTTLIPLSLTLAFSYRNWKVVIISIVASTLLFGMTHHKAVFFTSFLVLGLCVLFGYAKSVARVTLFPLVLVAIATWEVFANIYIHQHRELGVFASYFVRRTLLVPAMLDSAHIDFFSVFEKFYWSTSRFGLGLVKPPYDVAAPFVIGREIFHDPNMAANTGIIGSGYANAGMVGVLLYAAIAAAIIGFLNSLGRRLGHPFVAAASFPTILIIVTSADLTTVILTHGLLLLVVFLSLLPPSRVEITLKKPWGRPVVSGHPLAKSILHRGPRP
jgi:hypothetical protein